MTPLENLSVARFGGQEAGDFLHNQLSADIQVLAPGRASFACYCTPKGQVIGLLLVCRQDQGYAVVGSAVLMPQLLERLKKFVFRTRVEFSAEPELKVYGARRGEKPCESGTFQPGAVDLCYLVSARPPPIDTPAAFFKAEEIRRGVVWLGAETSEKFIPQMLGFDRIGAVSFSKGCYPGQEIVARTRYLGKVKRSPVIVRTTEPLAAKPAEKLELQREQSWSDGVVIDSAPAEDGTLLFMVAPNEPDVPPDHLKREDRLYRCATM